jgi:hypothetical protein
MKKGKSVKLNLYSTIKSVYGTVDSKELKSIFINIQSWVTPKSEQENWKRIVSCLCRDIKCTVNDSINKEIFKEHSIVDLDLRTSGIYYGKKSFFNLEINLFFEKQVDFKSHDVKESVKKIIKNIYKDNIVQNYHFDFSPSKKEYDNNLSN